MPCLRGVMTKRLPLVVGVVVGGGVRATVFPVPIPADILKRRVRGIKKVFEDLRATMTIDTRVEMDYGKEAHVVQTNETLRKKAFGAYNKLGGRYYGDTNYIWHYRTEALETMLVRPPALAGCTPVTRRMCACGPGMLW